MKLEPEQQEAIIAAGLAVVGLIGVFTKDKADVPTTDSAPAKAEYIPGFTIELQSRMDRGQTDSRSVDSVDHGADRPSEPRVAAAVDRVQSAMQSPIDVKKYRNVDPDPPHQALRLQ
jgi:hypothetical protein